MCSSDLLVTLERMGEKSAANLLSSIEKSKQQPLSRLIFALGIPFIGSRAATTLGDNIDDMESLQQAMYEDLIQIPEIGDKMAESIVTFFKQDQTKDLLNRLTSAGVNMEADKTQEKGPKPFDGITFVLTGTLEKYARTKVTEMIESVGGKVTGSVSKKTDYVVVGKDPGSKYDKAVELGIQVLDEKGFEELISPVVEV